MLSLRNIVLKTSYCHRILRINFSDHSSSDDGKKASIYSEHQDRPVNQNFEVLNFEKDFLYFTGFNELGFHTNMELRIVGPCAAFRKSTLFWNVNSALDISEAKLSLFTILEPKLDILVIGKGRPTDPIDHQFIHSIMKKHKIGVEILDTERALTTFNFLNSEGRYVAAGLIPATYIDFHAEERTKIAQKRNQRNLFAKPDDSAPMELNTRSLTIKDLDVTGMQGLKTFNIQDVIRPDLKIKRTLEERKLEADSKDPDPDKKKT